MKLQPGNSIILTKSIGSLLEGSMVSVEETNETFIIISSPDDERIRISFEELGNSYILIDWSRREEDDETLRMYEEGLGTP